MTIKGLLFIFLILNVCLTIDSQKRNGDIEVANQEIKNKVEPEKKILRNLDLVEGWFTSLLILFTVWGSYLCFVIFGFWLLILVFGDKSDKTQCDMYVGEKLKAIYLFKST